MTRPPIRPFEIDPNRRDLPPLELEVEPEPVEAGGEGDTTEAVLEDAEERRPSWRKRLLGLSLIAALGAMVVQAVVYIQALLLTQPLLGLPLAVLVGLTVLGIVGWIVGEWLQIRRLRGRADMRLRGERLIRSELHGEAPRLIADLKPALRPSPEGEGHLRRFEGLANDALNDGERLMLFERTVLGPVDRRAKRIVLECARDVGLLTALSPLGLLDGVLVLWRTTIMLRAISVCYGMRLGPAATLRLLRKCLRNAAIAGVADVVSHAAVEHLGASIVKMLSARAGQGLGNALLAARLGIEAMKQTRPLPFTAEEVPRLKHIREAVFESIVTLERNREQR